MLPFQMEKSGSPGNFPESAYRLLIVQMEVCRLSVGLLMKKQTLSYPFANGINGLYGRAHLCLWDVFCGIYLYDNILLQLYSILLHRTYTDWFKCYLTNRNQRVILIGHLSDLLNISCGVFQGSILGPILVLCYTKDSFNSSDLATILFGGDTTRFAENNYLRDLVDYVNVELNKMS
jgi:hypothetical protein